MNTITSLHRPRNPAAPLGTNLAAGTVALALLAVCGLGSCSKQTSSSQAGGSATPSAQLQGKLVLTGSSTLAPLIMKIGERFQQLHPGVEISVKTGGSARGVQDARQGTADIGMASRALTPDESDLVGLPIARDGICLLIHRDNPVRSLTDEQIAGIYTGAITNWKALGGPDAPITVTARSEGRSEVELFLHYFKLKKTDVHASIEAGDNDVGIKAVSADGNAIVYMSVGASERSARNGAPIRLLPITGVVASHQTIRTGDFPLSRPLTLVTEGFPKGLAKTFINYCLSSEVTDLIRQQDFVPFLD